VIAHEGLTALKKLRSAAKTAQALDNVEQVAETIRRLAWGPED
jgi:hypothetical protein